MECPNCKEIIPGHLAVQHTIQCYRNATKCRVCNQVIHKDKKRQHLEKWRNLDSLMREICEDNEEQVSLFFDHGLDVNLQFMNNKKYDEKTPIHIAAENGSLNVLLALISRGAGVDPLDREQRTPLTLAIENNRFACARSLIELGSDIE